MLGIAFLLAACGGDDDAAEAPADDTSAGSEAAADGDEATDDEGAGDEAAAEDSPYLAVGSEAPDFTARDQSGTTRHLSALRGGVVVLYFYPRDETPGCTAEACAFRDVWERYEDADVTVLGVSVDDVASHLAFAQHHSLPFSLIADVDASIATAYQVATRQGDTVYAQRVTYVIDAEGRIAHVFGQVDPGVHADEVLEVIGGL
ncbi:MAG: peroxiredoxin [Sandaracinaceae bacterium]|nr:peroxiredoxin [Sandaracinaceae bacterium]